jgi:hypothetical protein
MLRRVGVRPARDLKLRSAAIRSVLIDSSVITAIHGIDHSVIAGERCRAPRRRRAQWRALAKDSSSPSIEVLRQALRQVIGRLQQDSVQAFFGRVGDEQVRLVQAGASQIDGEAERTPDGMAVRRVGAAASDAHVAGARDRQVASRGSASISATKASRFASRYSRATSGAGRMIKS